MNTQEFEALLEKGDIEECGGCGAYSAYAYQDSNMDPNERERYEDCLDEPYDIYHIGACSCFEWTCGKCGTTWAERDSVYMSECYTHVDYSAEIEEW